MKAERQAFSPSDDSLHLIESTAKSLAPDDQLLAEWHNSYIENHKQRIALDLDIVKDKVPGNSNILEVGSIPLLLTTTLSRCNYNVTGCDLSPERYVSTIKSLGLDVVKCDIEKEQLPFPTNSFDAVIFNEIFEHLRINLIFTLSEVLRVMKPGGTLLLSSPNLKSLGGIKNYLFKNKAFSCSANIYEEYEKLQQIGHMGHVREYTTTEVVEFLEHIGFVVSGLIYRGRYSTNLGQLLIRTMPRLSPFVSYVAVKPVSNAI